MATQELNENIPTLTHIIQPGDKSMENHFDASCFDTDNSSLDNDKSDEPQKDALVTDNDSKQDLDQLLLENMFYEHSLKNEKPVAEAHIGEINESPEDISVADENPEEITSTVTTNELEIKEIELKNTIDLLISDAVKTVLPAIEKQLTEELSQQIYQKLLSELSSDN